MHEKVFQRLLKFYPPNILSMIKDITSQNNVFEKRKLFRTFNEAKNILIDTYCVGVLLLFMVTGGYQWDTTRDINAMFEAKIIEAESRIDVVSLRAIRATIKKCLILEAGTVERIGDLLPQLKAAKENCEKILKQNSIQFYTYDKLYKSFLEYLPGQRKENLFNQDINILTLKDLALYEAEIHQHKQKALNLQALDPNNTNQLKPGEMRDRLRAEKHHKQPVINDEDTDSNILNNQAVLAYQKLDYHRCIELFIANQEQFMANPTSYFNFLILCWEAGVYSDDFILTELTKITVNPYTGRQFSSLLYGLIYEGQNNWLAAKTNYGLAYQSASDGVASQLKLRYENAKNMDERYQEHFLFGHLEMSDIADICVSFDGKYAASFQKTSRIIVWNLENQKILKEIEDKNATCMDANARLDRLVVGLRSGLIVIFNLQYENEQIVNVDEIELGFHANTILQIKLNKDGLHGLSGGLDQYIALWNCSKKLLLTKIDIPGQYLRCCCINMNGENFMYATSGSFNVQFYHHNTGKKSVLPSISLERHRAQVTSVDITYDGLLGVSAGQDRMIYLWDLMRAEVIRQIEVASFVQRVALTPMGKFLSMTFLDGSLSLYETVTGVTWRTEKIDGKHSGVAVVSTNFAMEILKEGMEYKLMALLERHRDKLQKEFYDARGIGENTYQETVQTQNETQQSSPNRQSQASPSKTRTQAPMPVVIEADPEDESDYRRTTLRTTQRQQEEQEKQRMQAAENSLQAEEDVHDVNMIDELMLQDLFFENAVFKFLYFQNDEFTKRISYKDIQQEMASLNLDRAKDPYAKNTYLLKNSIEQLEPTANMSPYERGFHNFQILNHRRKRFDVNPFRSQKQLDIIRDTQSLCKLLVLTGESKRGEDSDITQQGSIVGLRFQQISLPMLGVGPCQMITHSDQSKNILFKIAMKAKEMRQKGVEAFEQKSNEQAKYYLQRMREVQSLHLNPASVKVWAELQGDSFKKGMIQNVFKLRNLEIQDKHYGSIDHIKFSKNDKYVVLYSNYTQIIL